MNKVETAKLLVMVSSLDRQPTDEGMVEMWHRVLGDYDFTECEAAVVPAYREAKGYISARLVETMVKKARAEAIEQSQRQERLQVEADTREIPPPNCRAHRLPIATCIPCCVTIYNKAEIIGEGWSLHNWAVANVYEDVTG
jgi:hypothetical protein